MQKLQPFIRYWMSGVSKPIESLCILSYIKDADSLSRRSVPKLFKDINANFKDIKVEFYREFTDGIYSVSLALYNIWGKEREKADYYKISFINGRAVLASWVYHEGDDGMCIHPHIDRVISLIRFVSTSDDITLSKIMRYIKSFNTGDNDEILVKIDRGASYYWDNSWNVRQISKPAVKRWRYTEIKAFFGGKDVYIEININILSTDYQAERDAPFIYDCIGNGKRVTISMPKIVRKIRNQYIQF